MISRAPEPRRTVAALCAHKLHESAVAMGLDPAKLLPCDPHDADAEAFEARVSYDSQLALWETLMRATNDCGFPVAVGARSQPKDHDVIGFADRTRASLREALDLAIRYGSVWSDGSRWDLAEGERTITLTLHLKASDRLGARCLTECLRAEIIHSGRLLTGLDVNPVEVRFRHRAPRDTGAIEAFFKAPVRFGAPQNQLVLDAALLATPLLKADPDLAAFFARSADDVLERHGAKGLLPKPGAEPYYFRDRVDVPLKTSSDSMSFTITDVTPGDYVATCFMDTIHGGFAVGPGDVVNSVTPKVTAVAGKTAHTKAQLDFAIP